MVTSNVAMSTHLKTVKQQLVSMKLVECIGGVCTISRPLTVQLLYTKRNKQLAMHHAYSSHSEANEGQSYKHSRFDVKISNT